MLSTSSASVWLRIATLLPALGLGLAAQEPLRGAVVLYNATNSAVLIEADACRNAVGERDLQGASWEVQSGRLSYLMVGDQKLVASEFRGWLTTSEGSTYWTWSCRSLDADGDFVMEVAPETIRHHYEILSRRPMLGVHTVAVGAGVRIELVVPESAAATAGLRDGDVIVQLDDNLVETPADLTNFLLQKKLPGQTVRVLARRNGELGAYVATLGAAARPLPSGPSDEAIATAALKAAAATLAWHLAWDIYQRPSDNVLEEILKAAALEVAREALREGMASAVTDLAPMLGTRDRATVANVLVALAQGDAATIRLGASGEALGRLLTEQGMSRQDAQVFGAVLARIASHVQRNGD